MDVAAATSGKWQPFGRAAVLLTAVVIVYRVCIITYRLYFSPLARIPGPKLHGISYLPFLYKNRISGTFAKDEVPKLHEKYGPVVRISPNQVAVDGSVGWSQVFARRPNQTEFAKYSPFYSPDGDSGIFTAAREDHRRQRRIMGHAFSESALREQWPLINKYADMFIQRWKEHADAGKPVDVTSWFNFLTFDIIGDLAFADPFNSIEQGNYHPWVAMIFHAIKTLSSLQLVAQYPILSPLLIFVMSKEQRKAFKEHKMLSVSKAEKRIAMGPNESRKDFMTYILRHNVDGKEGMNHRDMVMNSEGFIVAGSETTATALSGFIFLLGTNRQVYNLLVAEVRNAFKSDQEINMVSTAGLSYLHATLEETLRFYPPAVETPQRVSPGDYVDNFYIPQGTHVSIYQWATHHSARNFVDPDKFAPQRFLPASHPLYENKYAQDNKAAFKPFAAGPRDCLGKNLAYAEMRVIAAKILWNFDFEILPGQGDWMSAQKAFTVYVRTPLNIKLTHVVR